MCSEQGNRKVNDLRNIYQGRDSKTTRSICQLFSEDPTRAKSMSLSTSNLYLDFSKQNISQSELDSLILWAKEKGLESQISAMFNGEKINNTEQRSVLHSILRAPEATQKSVLGDRSAEVIETDKKLESIVDGICSGEIASATGKKFTDVLAIGIGGSYYGIKVGLSALTPYHSTGIKVHVVANVDGNAIERKLAMLDPETTCVVVISKTFSTQETLLNATAAKNWMLANASSNETISKQWFAISTNIEAATDFGLLKTHIFPMWDWVGGRFSIWSAVGFPLALAIGNEAFSQFKQGAFKMDKHLTSAPFEKNMPVLLALLGIWNRNVLGYSSLAILPYDHSLRALPGYLQQTDMESNGKSVDKQGEKLSFPTAPIVFGQEGTNGQHAFMQLMHQSDDIIPTDFIAAVDTPSALKSHQKVLLANCFAQSEALMRGKTLEQARKELVDSGASLENANKLAPHKMMKGNTPSNTLLMGKLTPESLGALLALYEHKIFVQGALWGLNSFDQWGVELGKELGGQILNAMDGQVNQHLSESSKLLIEKALEGLDSR